MSLNRFAALILIAAVTACDDTPAGTDVTPPGPVDTTPPTVSMTPAGSATDCDVAGGWVNTATVAVRFEANESGSTIAFTLDGADPAGSPTSCGGPCTSPVTVSNLAEGKSEVRFFAKDKVGNKSAESKGFFCIDRTAPTLAISPAGGYLRNDAGTDLATIRTNSETVTLRYTTDGSDPKTSGTRVEVEGFAVGAARQVALTNGTIVKFYGIDRAGNESAVATRSYNIIAKNPSVSGTLHVNAKYFGQAIHIFAQEQGDYGVLAGPQGNPDRITAEWVKKLNASTVDSATETFTMTFDGVSDAGKGLYFFVAVDEDGNGKIDARNCAQGAGGYSCDFEPIFPAGDFLDNVLADIGDPAAGNFNPATDWTITGLDFYLDIQDPALAKISGTVNRADASLDEMRVITWQETDDGLVPMASSQITFDNAADLTGTYQVINLPIDCLGGANSTCDYYPAVWMGPASATAVSFDEQNWFRGFESLVVGAGDQLTANFFLGTKRPGKGSIAGRLTFPKELPAGSLVSVTAMSDTVTDTALILDLLGEELPYFAFPLATYRIKLLANATFVDYLIGDLPLTGTPQVTGDLDMGYVVNTTYEAAGRKTPPALRQHWKTGGAPLYSPIDMESVTDVVGIDITVPVALMTGKVDAATDNVMVQGVVQFERILADGSTDPILAVNMAKSTLYNYAILGIPAGSTTFQIRAAGCGDKNNNGNYFDDGGLAASTSAPWTVVGDGSSDVTQNTTVDYTGLVCQ